MDRRGFLKGLIGAAAAPVVAKIADAFDGPDFIDPEETAWEFNDADGEWTVIDLRAISMRRLGQWLADRYDSLLFDELMGKSRGHWRIGMDFGDDPSYVMVIHPE